MAKQERSGDNPKTQEERRMKSDVENQDRKRRRKRGKRGTKRKREKNSISSSPSNTAAAPATAAPHQVPTVWRALETEWFRTVDDDPLPKLPEPLSLSFITSGKNKQNNKEEKEKNTGEYLDHHYDCLRRLWYKFSSRKRQRQKPTSRGAAPTTTTPTPTPTTTAAAAAIDDERDCWKPRPIQLQAWSILIPRSATTKEENQQQEKEEENEGERNESVFNMIGLSPTASGKTLAFGAPMVVAAAAAAAATSFQQQQQESIKNNEKTTTKIQNQVFGIVLVPTRELASQVSREIELMVNCVSQSQKKLPIRVLTACGGGGGSNQSTQDQINILRKGGSSSSSDNNRRRCWKWIIIATPGRFLDILQKSSQQPANNNNQQQEDSDSCLLFQPRYICLDECDRLATNTDLAQQVTSILKSCMKPQSTTTTRLALFSATYPSKAREIWKEWMSLNERSCVMVRVDTVSLEKTNNNSDGSPKKKPKSMDNSVDEEGNTCQVLEKEEETKGRDIATASSMSVGHSHADNDDEAGNNFNNRQPSSNGTKTSDFLSKIPAHLVQTLHVCAEHKKPKKLINTLDRVRREEKADGSSRQKRLGIIFFGRIKTLQYISKLLTKQSNHDCLELHSQLPQHTRTRNMQMFQAGKIPLLLASDIAARGLHVSNVGFVINYDFPPNLEQYVHRCGRAGRNYNDKKNTNNNIANNKEKKATKGGGGLPPTIYSFFTRPMAAMAPDLVALLEASNSWVDPNLKALVLSDTSHHQSHGKKKKKGASNENNNNVGGNTSEGSAASKIEQEVVTTEADNNQDQDQEEEAFSDDDAFPELSATKVVLKRADHVSDASSSSSSSSSEDDDSEG